MIPRTRKDRRKGFAPYDFVIVVENESDERLLRQFFDLAGQIFQVGTPGREIGFALADALKEELQ